MAEPAPLRSASLSQLEDLATQVRAFLLANISKTGGHIGANLGTVELTIALHACFDSPKEPLLFDTGHQGYTHKLLTGRRGLFASLNQYGGMNRFLTPDESEHDWIEASHAGTAISVGLGFALAKRLRGDDSHVVATVGDSAFVEGISLEAFNHALAEDTNLIVVLNDNGYAISPGFGGFHNTLQAGGDRARSFFESLGARYHGPVDGHDLAELLGALESAKSSPGLSVVHARTTKGKDWAPADEHPFRMHFSFPFDEETGEAKVTVAPDPGYPEVVAEVIDEHMSKNPSSVCITPSTLYATGLAPIFEKYPERCFDPGMEEQHALSMCVGFSLSGQTPIIAYQSTFLQRAFDQIIHDIAFANRPCLMLSYRSGFSGYDNPTHHGIYDIAYLRPVPNLRVFYPKDRWEAQAMVRSLLDDLSGPVLVMMPYGPADSMDESVLDLPRAELLRPETVRPGTDVALVSVGNKVAACLDAAERLGVAGISAEVINLRQLKPLPAAELAQKLAPFSTVVTVEEAVIEGGVGSAVGAMLFSKGMNHRTLMRLGLPTRFIEAGSNIELERAYGLDGRGIADRVRSAMRSAAQKPS
ncbi:MAG: 1-deoxy-D-xylulose-5-phosphate synthase [Myxococcota bacterium]